MSTSTLIVIIVIFTVIVALAARRGGPRVTHIDRTVRKTKEGEE